MTDFFFYVLQNSIVLSSEDNCDKKYRSSVNSRNIDVIFNNLEFNHLKENTLIVQELKNQEKILNTTFQSSSGKINGNKGKV